MAHGIKDDLCDIQASRKLHGITFPQTIWGEGQVFIISSLSRAVSFVGCDLKLARKSENKKTKKSTSPVFISSTQVSEYKLPVDLFLFSFTFSVFTFSFDIYLIRDQGRLLVNCTDNHPVSGTDGMFPRCVRCLWTSAAFLLLPFQS